MATADVREWLFDGKYGTGAIYETPDPRNYRMECVADVQAQLVVGYPDSDEHLLEHVKHIYSQGASPSCVWHAISGQQTINEHIERRGELLIFDAMAMHNATGDPNQGRYTGDMLTIAQNQGTKLAASSKRYKIGSYAFAPKDSPQNWEATIKAAVAAGHPCGLALLLPSNFSWESSGSIVPNSYHETMIVGYRPAFLLLNSWGSSWGKNGLGWVPISFLTQSSYQSGYVFANLILDAIDDDLAPNPPDPPQPPHPSNKRYVLTATATGSGMDTMKSGGVLVASGGGYTGNLGITNVSVYDDVTPPSPGTLSVTGYEPTSVKPTATFTVKGAGFGSGGNLFVFWQGRSLSIISHSDTAISVQAADTEGTAPVVVRVEGSGSRVLARFPCGCSGAGSRGAGGCAAGARVRAVCDREGRWRGIRGSDGDGEGRRRSTAVVQHALHQHGRAGDVPDREKPWNGPDHGND